MENCLLLSIALADIDLRSFSSVINSFICLIYSDISSLGIANPLTLSVIMSVNEAKLRKAKGTQPYCCASVNVSPYPSKDEVIIKIEASL